MTIVSLHSTINFKQAIQLSHIWCVKYAFIDDIDNDGKTNITNATPIAHIKIFYKKRKPLLYLFVCVLKYRCVLLFQVLSDVRTAVNEYEHVHR